MSVTTNRSLDQATFDATVGGPWTFTGGPFSLALTKTITGVDGTTDQQIQAAVTAAGDFFASRQALMGSSLTGLKQAYPTLRQWAQDAATANTNWPTMTAAQKDATTRESIRRLGVFLDRFGDALILLNGDA